MRSLYAPKRPPDAFAGVALPVTGWPARNGGTNVSGKVAYVAVGGRSGANSREVTLHELLDADEVFVCGTAAEASAIAVLDRREFGDNPVTRELSALYARVVRGQEPGYAHWLTAV